MKRGMKKLVTLAVSLTLALSFAVTSFAGTWIYDGPENWKWWYREDDGSYPANVWKMIDGSWYHFDANGYLDVGWTLIDDKYYYLENTSDGNVGKMRTSGTWDYGYISADRNRRVVLQKDIGRLEPPDLPHIDGKAFVTLDKAVGQHLQDMLQTVVDHCLLRPGMYRNGMPMTLQIEYLPAGNGNRPAAEDDSQ